MAVVRDTPPAFVDPAVDLQTQLEAFLDAVWEAEKDWRLMDRIDAALGYRRDVATHRCLLPGPSLLSYQTFDCPACHQLWACAYLSTHWLPA